jgi:signal peptidase I
MSGSILRQRAASSIPCNASLSAALVGGRLFPRRMQSCFSAFHTVYNWQIRSLSSRSGRKSFGRGSAHHRGQQQRRTSDPKNATPESESAPVEPSIHATKQDPRSGWKQWFDQIRRSDSGPLWLAALRWIVPIRYRFPTGQCRPDYSFHQGILIAQRLVLFTALALIGIVYDETAPFELVGIRGPSMIPTMAADGSDLWICRTYASWWRQYWNTDNVLVSIILPRFKRGDIVGFAHPDRPNSAISCKRIVGLPGDRVQRYGQYVHLFLDQDPEAWGISWPMDEDPNHAWITNQGKSWDTTRLSSISANTTTETPLNPKAEPMRTIVVPEGHVWIEADCPALGLDSRQFGPIPITWIRTRVIAKVWPLQSPPLYRKWNQRPHPIPLDMETLMEYNVFHLKKREN